MDQLVGIMNGFTSMMITHMSAPNVTGSGPILPTSFTHPPPGFTPLHSAAAAAHAVGISSLGPVGTAPLAPIPSFSGLIMAIQPPTVATGPLPTSTAAASQVNTGYDSDDSHYSGIPRTGAGNRGRSNGRRSGTSRHNHAGSSRSSTHSNRDTGFVSTSDDDPEFEDNRRTRENKYCKKLDVNKYSSTDKNQDFVIWINQFEQAVKRQLNPHSKERHWKQCLKWLPLSLSSDAYAIWQRASCKDSDWIALRLELEESFEDIDVRAEWKSNMKAFVWDEVQPLRVYLAKVERYVDTFDKELIRDPEGRKSQYYTRFVNGLPADYAEYIVLSMPAKCLDVNKALEACLRFQSTKKRKTPKAEVGASANFSDATLSARVAQNEANQVRLDERLKKIEKQPKEVTYASDYNNFRGATGRSPRFQQRQNSNQNFNPNFRSNNSNGRNYQRNGSQDRMKKFLAKKRNPQGYENKQQEDENAAGTEETFALTEGEEEEVGDPMNSTQELFMEYTQAQEAERYDTFCALKNAGN